ncbi:hypothetical protein DFAR_2550018 [Desulfarculales bacterium]
MEEYSVSYKQEAPALRAKWLRPEGTAAIKR